MLFVQKKSGFSVCCIGAGYVGGITGAVIAEKCRDVDVYVVDINGDRIAQWNSDTLPIYEAGLDAIVKRTRDRNLFFTTSFKHAVGSSVIVFLCVNTPIKKYGADRGRVYDLAYTEKAVIEIMKHTDSDKIIVEKSTVPCKTAEKIRALVEKTKKHKALNIEILSNPEFLAQGSAVGDLLDPDRVLIGSFPTDRGSSALGKLSALYRNWIPQEKIIASSIWTAELAKLAANALLAQRISSINALGELCEKVGADVLQLSGVVGKDRRIGEKYLSCGIGFGGSCLEKDVCCLVYLCDYHGLPDAAEYWRQVLSMNRHQKERFTRKITEKMFSSVSGKRIAVLGAAFKKGTSDTRDSPAAAVMLGLLEEHATLAVYDPVVSREEILDALGAKKGQAVSVCDSVEDACRGSSAVVVCTEWDVFRKIDFERVYSVMEKPAYVFDGRNILDRKKLAAIGFDVYSVGRL
ncbi:MAG: UDP-glucose 6-dehydrogenase [Amphiamblys sp. WSBS2006]|nr:MAG: UDP-glucose 6-dehydrogenase [Amphiamblys sp. WSBS2006]